MNKFLANILMGDCAASKNILQPLLNFGFRFYVAYVFLKSGLTKVDNKFQVTDSTKDLFAYEYNVPLLPSDLAAYLATYAEIIFPVLLVLGILSRPTAIGLFVLNAVAMIYVASTEFATVGLWQHTTWGVMLAMVIAYGPSKISIDSWIATKLRGDDSNILIKLASIVVLSGIAYFLFSTYL